MALNKGTFDLSASVEAVRAALASGALADYRPLAVAGAEFGKSTCMTSWGPQMKR